MAYQNRTSCPTLSLFHILGERWSIPAIETLYYSKGNMQFNSILEEIGSITPKNLSGCLKNLIESGLVEKRTITYMNSAQGTEYGLTKNGRLLEKYIMEIKRMGTRWYKLDNLCQSNRCSKCPLFSKEKNVCVFA